MKKVYLWEFEKKAFENGILIEFRSRSVCGFWSDWKLATNPLWHQNGDTEYRIAQLSS